jgi:lipopolysaccharide biosynthesis glycosyltransferase
MVVDRRRWLERRVTERCFEFLQGGPASIYDQSALNYALWNDWQLLDTRFNFISNWRKNWPCLLDKSRLNGKLLHILENPKTWSLFAEVIHPQYGLWREVLERTAMKDFRSWHNTPSRQFPRTREAWIGYKKAFKDRLLFAGYSRGWLKKVKGVPLA